jgi:hypothetical protein
MMVFIPIFLILEVVAGFKVIIDEENSSKELLSWAKKMVLINPK